MQTSSRHVGKWSSTFQFRCTGLIDLLGILAVWGIQLPETGHEIGI